MTWKQTFATRPYSKGRPQFNRKTGSAYTPKNTRDYEKLIASLYNGPKFAEGPIWVSLTFNEYRTTIEITGMDAETTSSKLRGDIDNYAKSILDALNGVAFTDDKQIMRLDLRKK